MHRLIVAILDNKANDTVPQTLIWVHKAVAPAIRMYTDAVTDTRGEMHKHVEDYDLVQLGTIDDENKLHPDYEILMTGKAYLASLPQQDVTPIRSMGTR